MVQEWFVAGARFGFIGFFTTFVFLGLWILVSWVLSLIGIIGKDGDNNEP